MLTSGGMKRTSHCALHLRTRAEHMNNTNAHTTIHNPYDIAGVRSSTFTTSTNQATNHQTKTICQDLSISTIPKNCKYFPGEQMHLGGAANNSVHTCKQLQGFATRYFLLCHSNLDKMTFGPRIPHLKGFQWGPVHGREPPRSVQTNRPSALWPQRRENTKDKLRLRDLRLRTDDTRPPQPILNIETIWNTWDLRDCLCPVAD